MVSIDKQFFLEGLENYALTEEFRNLSDAVFNGPFKIKKISMVIALIIEAMKVVEQLAADMGEIASGSGKAKKDAVVGWLDGTLDLPFFLEPFDGPAISICIDGLITFFNIKLSHNWLPKIRQIF